MPLTLRKDQQAFKSSIYQAWEEGYLNVLGVAPTGFGKTVCFANIAHEHRGSSMLIAHRQELVSQISLALGVEGVRHRIIAPDNTIKLIERSHLREFGQSFHTDSARTMVGGVDTLNARAKSLASICEQVTLMIQDEAHHVLSGNKWGKAAALFPNARGLLVTATPERSDGKGLGSHADGIADILIRGPEMRDVINRGDLTEYRIFAPESDIDISDVEISGATGDYNAFQLRKAVERSHIVGDVVDQYLKIAPGKQGICFVTDVATAGKVADKFNAAGVLAASLSAKSDASYRDEIIRRFRVGEIMMLVNVDLFGEGFDVPAVEVCIFARHTASFAVYAQQFGRALRKFKDKTHGIIIDHVSNVKRHGLPDRLRNWTLDRRDKRSKGKRAEDLIPCITCDGPTCGQVYEAIYSSCPHCGWVPVILDRSGPKQVQGDLTEIDPEVLAMLRGEVEKIDMTPSTLHQNLIAGGMPGDWAAKHAKDLRNTQFVQGSAEPGNESGLRGAIAYWAGYHRGNGSGDSEIYRRFFFKYGVDVMSAKALKAKDAQDLREIINDELAKLGHETRY